MGMTSFSRSAVESLAEADGGGAGEGVGAAGAGAGLAAGAVDVGFATLGAGEGAPATQALPEPPLVPTLEAARAASAGYIGRSQRVHPICFTCGPERDEGDGLRVFPGQLAGAEQGVMACTWTPHAASQSDSERASLQ